MKVDQEVSYLESDGKRHSAVITGISGVGPNNFKTLNLRYKVEGEEVLVEDVPYQDDAGDAEAGFWVLKGQRVDRDRAPDPIGPESTQTKRKRKKTA